MARLGLEQILVVENPAKFSFSAFKYYSTYIWALTFNQTVTLTLPLEWVPGSDSNDQRWVLRKG